MALNVCLVIGCAVVCLQYVQYRHCNSNAHVLHTKMSCVQTAFSTRFLSAKLRFRYVQIAKSEKQNQRLKFCTLPELFNGHAGSTAGPTGTTACCGQRVQ